MEIAVNSSELKSLTHTHRETVDHHSLQKLTEVIWGYVSRGYNFMKIHKILQLSTSFQILDLVKIISRLFWLDDIAFVLSVTTDGYCSFHNSTFDRLDSPRNSNININITRISDFAIYLVK